MTRVFSIWECKSTQDGRDSNEAGYGATSLDMKGVFSAMVRLSAADAGVVVRYHSEKWKGAGYYDDGRSRALPLFKQDLELL